MSSAAGESARTPIPPTLNLPAMDKDAIEVVTGKAAPPLNTPPRSQSISPTTASGPFPLNPDSQLDPLETGGPAEKYHVIGGEEPNLAFSAPLVLPPNPPNRVERRRESSSASLTFTVPSTPVSQSRRSTLPRLRAPSPPHPRFQAHVGFDGLVGEATKVNLPAITLNVKHKGYHPRKRSRTFMAGVDENPYSEYALQWLLDELVDDGDEVVCLHVIEREPRHTDHPLHDAQAVIKSILARNGANRAISVVLEYAFGKVTSTFQKMIIMYQPSMLIVGTKGRSHGGFQSLVSGRNSFSKYCLQFSPVPVVVVRPPVKRQKKKLKRTNDPTRHLYSQMLASSNGQHEVDADVSVGYEFEVNITADEEAHQVARALGMATALEPYRSDLPAKQPDVPSRRQTPDPLSRLHSPDPLSRLHVNGPPASHPEPVNDGRAPPKLKSGSTEGAITSRSGAINVSAATDGGAGRDGEDDYVDEDEDVDPDFDVVSGKDALNLTQKELLHNMEVSEARALMSRDEVASDDEE